MRPFSALLAFKYRGLVAFNNSRFAAFVINIVPCCLSALGQILNEAAYPCKVKIFCEAIWALQAVRSLVALAAVAAVFLFEWGATLEWQAVHLLAQLGGWVPRKDARPGKIILTRGLRRLLDLLAARAILTDYLAQHGDLPPQVAAFLPDDFW